MKAGLPNFTAAVEKGSADPRARYQMSRCSLLAGLLLSPINTGAAHALGYGIEKVSHARGKPVPHGTAVALVLPGVMRHNAPAAGDKYYYAAGVAGIDLSAKSREEAVDAVADWIDRLRRRYTPYGSLAAAGLGEEDLPRMVEVGHGGAPPARSQSGRGHREGRRGDLPDRPGIVPHVAAPPGPMNVRGMTGRIRSVLRASAPEGERCGAGKRPGQSPPGRSQSPLWGDWATSWYRTRRAGAGAAPPRTSTPVRRRAPR